MKISDRIEQFILELLKNEDDWIELKRNELAVIFNCVPSQINYVMTTRFNEQRGYIVESRRGGGGYIRVKRLYIEDDNKILNVLAHIEAPLDFDSAKALAIYLKDNKELTQREYNMMLQGISDKSLNILDLDKDYIRASVFKNMLIGILQENDN